MALLRRTTLGRGGAVLACCALLAACELQRDPTQLEFEEGDEALAVYSLLVAGADSAAVQVIRYPVRPPAGGDEFAGVGGAQVRLIHPGGTLTLVEQTTTGATCLAPQHPSVPRRNLAGCYVARVPGGIVPGATYGLEVSVGGREIEGSTQVPHPPVVLDPTPGERVRLPSSYPNVGTLPVSIQPGAGTGVLRLVLYETDPARSCSIFPPSSPDPFGSIYLEPDEVQDAALELQPVFCSTVNGMPASSDELPAVLRVSAFEPEHARWVEDVIGQGESVRLPLASAGLEGAIGFFSAMAWAERAITVDTTP